jgi:hypothetical protein
MYRVSYEEGNGYHCSCCRRTQDRTVDLETAEDLISFLVEFYADIEYSKFDHYDKELQSIEKEIGVELLQNYVDNKAIKDLVKKEVDQRKLIDKEKDEKDKKDAIERKDKEERALFENLKEKFDN